jgi:amino acid transporter
MIEAEAALQQPRLRRVMGPGVLLLFIIGDILGTGVYALIGDVAAEVGGAAWVPFLLAFLIAAITALSYLELVTKYPQAAGAALYAQKAFDKPFITFLVAFVVMCAGITSAATASRFFAANFFIAFEFNWGTAGLVIVALVFMAVLAAVNLRGVGESMLMASRLIYGMARQRVLPPLLGTVSRIRRSPWVAIVFTTAIAFGVILYVTAFANSNAIAVLGDTTSLLLLAVFAMVNVAVLVLRRDVRRPRRHFRTPTPLPAIGCVASLYLVTPLSGRAGQQYLLAGILIASGVVLSLVTLLFSRRRASREVGIGELAPVAVTPG